MQKSKSELELLQEGLGAKPKLTLIKKLGEGGNACVYSCRDEHGQDFAIKFLKEKTTTRQRDRFNGEANLLLGLKNYFGVVRVHETSKNYSTEPPWFLMDLLSPVINVYGFDVCEKVRILGETAENLAALHKSSIFHRDIKPSNMLYGLSSRGRQELQFSDFGLAKDGRREFKVLTGKGDRIGSHGFLPPELMESSVGVDFEKSDVYSFAKSIWCIITGKDIPFQGEYNRRDERHSLLPYFNDTSYRLRSLESLLNEATRSDPSSRPRSSELASGLIELGETMDDFRKESPSLWRNILDDVNHGALFSKCEWTDASAIAHVLKEISRFKVSNYTIFPTRGGHDLAGVILDGELLCLLFSGEGMAATSFLAMAVDVNGLKLTCINFPGEPDNAMFVLSLNGKKISSAHGDVIKKIENDESFHGHKVHFDDFCSNGSFLFFAKCSPWCVNYFERYLENFFTIKDVEVALKKCGFL